MSERFMENAQLHQEQMEQHALEEVRAKANKLPPPDWDCRSCYDCGDDIEPKERAALGYWRCLKCQDVKDRGSRLFRR